MPFGFAGSTNFIHIAKADMARISQLRGFQILDSRGNPTVAAKVVLGSGATSFAAAPSGASTGSSTFPESTV